MAVVMAGLGAVAAYRGLRRWARSPRWNRTNHAGRAVTLLEGPAWTAGAVLGTWGSGPAGPVAVLGSAAFGALDDLAGDSSAKGLRGHFGAMARGEVTTGAVKVVGIGLCALTTAILVDRERVDRRLLDTLVGGAVIAGAANLANLLDLRPGRALKVTVLAASPMVVRRGVTRGPSRRLAAAAIGASFGVIGPDLAGEAMLGDTGANAAGALVGAALVGATGRTGRMASLTVLVGLTLISERISFTRVIESTPGLRELDGWGRARR
jgi:UDP-N-acetylmuramyl pentapeptide phosphotransferase/UDP-N-acetylglucosamine-1-phosphate transferase